MVTHIRKLACATLIAALTGCSNDGPPPEPPKAVKPEPKPQVVLNVADFPAIEYTYYLKSRTSGVNSIYRLAVGSTTVTRVNISDQAQFYRPEVFLGESRYTTAWAFMEDGGRLFRLDPADETPTQISSLNTKLCPGKINSFQNGVGLSSLTLVVQAAGTDAICGTADDTWYETPADAAPTDAPAGSYRHRLEGLALNASDGSLTGFAEAVDTGIRLYDSAGNEKATLSTTSGVMDAWQRGDGDFWIRRGPDVYRVPVTLMTEGTGTSTLVHRFSQTPAFVEPVPAMTGDANTLLVAVDGHSVVTIAEDETVNSLVADLSGALDTPESLAAYSNAWFYIQGQHGGSDTLIAVNRTDGSVVSVAGNLKGDVVAVDGYLFYSTHDGTDYTGFVWSEATQSVTTTLNNARWVRMPVYTEDGRETRLLRYYRYDQGDNRPVKRILSWVEPVSLAEYAQYGQLVEDSDVLDVDAANKTWTLMLIHAKSGVSTLDSVYSLNLSSGNSLKGTSVSVDPASGDSIRFR
ncbi:hypothetical protein AAIA72_11865 [Hahella sp. SMD15-11]|uniref:Uncharacterized protein n=1 Tax=Thermohahella caldifontis TaxID=3142973 RepID=A0AB39UTA0_9GAMM